MDWLLFTAIVLSAITAAAASFALISYRLVSSIDREAGKNDYNILSVFLCILLCNQIIGFLLYTASSQSAFLSFIESGVPLARLLALITLIIQYAVFVSTVFIIPRLFRVSLHRFLLWGIATISLITLLLRILSTRAALAVLVLENAAILPLVYGVWIYSLRSRDNNDPLLVFLVIALIPAGLLERAAVDPLWPVPQNVRELISSIPLSLIILLLFSGALSVRNIRLIKKGPHKSPELPDFSKYKLSPRELEIAQLLYLGYVNKEIAQKLSLGYGTVKNHVYSLYNKLGIRSRYELHKYH